jgi:hypothetical protein
VGTLLHPFNSFQAPDESALSPLEFLLADAAGLKLHIDFAQLLPDGLVIQQFLLCSLRNFLQDEPQSPCRGQEQIVNQ